MCMLQLHKDDSTNQAYYLLTTFCTQSCCNTIAQLTCVNEQKAHGLQQAQLIGAANNNTLAICDAHEPYQMPQSILINLKPFLCQIQRIRCVYEVTSRVPRS